MAQIMTLEDAAYSNLRRGGTRHVEMYYSIDPLLEPPRFLCDRNCKNNSGGGLIYSSSKSAAYAGSHTGVGAE